MKRLRSLSLLIACLVVMAAGRAAFANSAEGLLTYVERMTVTALSSHHPYRDQRNCAERPCAAAMQCAAPCVASILSASAIDLTLVATDQRGRPLDLAELVGQRPPPNPFPPRI